MPPSTDRSLAKVLDDIANEALASGDQAILNLVEEADEILLSRESEPNVFERMENIVAAIDMARDKLTDAPDWQPEDIVDIDNAYGIAGEVLKLIGRPNES